MPTTDIPPVEMKSLPPSFPLEENTEAPRGVNLRTITPATGAEPPEASGGSLEEQQNGMANGNWNNWYERSFNRSFGEAPMSGSFPGLSPI
jgi:hypothetical protein